ncbi:hypothetical protein SCLARK_001690 [Spiroplasma clarkii]|uniref:hypothetical protein n=1 Tax=Spiroplasma clarkii TaxID=2139 RepID=UPI000B576710|nr:hypothetical protein [Spiroplasma clarkii]ARU92154.1 hypothetical protein SCLARK_001690 [Spiroplasma clarkii]
MFGKIRSKKVAVPTNENPDLSLQHFKEYNKYLNGFNKGANNLAFKNYDNTMYLDRRFNASQYVPTDAFLHECDLVEVYLSKEKTFAADIKFIEETPGVFRLGMSGDWSSTLGRYLNPDPRGEQENPYQSYMNDDVITSFRETPDDYVLAFTATNYGLLFHHIASEINISRVVVNGLRYSPSRGALVYQMPTDGNIKDESYKFFWKKLYFMLDNFIGSNSDVNYQLRQSIPVIIFKSKKFNIIIDTVKMFLFLETARISGHDFRNSNLNNFLEIMDQNYALTNQVNGVSSEGVGDLNFEYAFQKENIFMSDKGPSQFHCGEDCLMITSNLDGEQFYFKNFLATRPFFFLEKQFTTTFANKRALGYANSNIDVSEDMKIYYSQDLWDMFEVLGETYQNNTYTLKKRLPVTAKINPIGVTKLLYKNGYMSSPDSSFIDMIKSHSGFRNANPSFITGGIRKNALYEDNAQGKNNYSVTNRGSVELIGDVETIFWAQLILGLSDGFIPSLNNYYRYHKDDITVKIAELTSYYAANSESSYQNFVPAYQACWDILLEAITVVAQINLTSFFEKWGLEVPASVKNLAKSFGTDQGQKLFGIILDKDLSGIYDSKLWVKNMQAGFALKNSETLLKPFSEWGVLSGSNLLMNHIIDNDVSPRNKSTQIVLKNAFVNSKQAAIHYLSSYELQSNSNSSQFVPSYLKIRGNTINGSHLCNYSFHLWVDKRTKKIKFKSFDNWIDASETDFAKISLFDESQTKEINSKLISKETMTLNSSFAWSFNSGNYLKIEFLNKDFSLDTENGDGTKIYNHSKCAFESIYPYTTNGIFSVKLA